MTNLAEIMSNVLTEKLEEMDVSEIISSTVKKTLEKVDIAGIINRKLTEQVETLVDENLYRVVDGYVDMAIDDADYDQAIVGYLDDNYTVDADRVEEAIGEELGYRDLESYIDEAIADKVESYVDDNIGTMIEDWVEGNLDLE